MKKIYMTVAGIIFLIVGITLVLKEWNAVTIVFKGLIGGILAVGGLIMVRLAQGGDS